MKSIFEMSDEELKELHEPIILPGFGIRKAKLTPTAQYIKLQESDTLESFSINKEMNLNQYKALKSIIDHQIAYLEQKEKDSPFNIVKKEIEQLLESTKNSAEKKFCTYLLNKVNEKVNEFNPKKEEFKVGWVYEDGNGNKFLIINKDKDENFLETHGLTTSSRFFSFDGKLDYNVKSQFQLNDNHLIHSTGKKWEPEE